MVRAFGALLLEGINVILEVPWLVLIRANCHRKAGLAPAPAWLLVSPCDLSACVHYTHESL